MYLLEEECRRAHPQISNPELILKKDRIEGGWSKDVTFSKITSLAFAMSFLTMVVKIFNPGFELRKAIISSGQ